MQLQIKTDILKDMVSRAIKGAGCNKLIPLTSMMSIELKAGTLILHTTDMTNHLYIKTSNIAGDDFYVTIQVEQFSKLISKLTCENVELELKSNALEVRGNGRYSIELPLDENGELIQFPDPAAKSDLPVIKTIDLAIVKSILNVAKPSLAVTLEVPCYTGYYVGDSVMTTNRAIVCNIDMNLLGTPVLISSEMMDLLDIMEYEKIEVRLEGEIIQFSTPDCVVYGYLMNDIDSYAVKDINSFLQTSREMDSFCKVSKSAMLALLDRIALFTQEYDNRAIQLTFTPQGINISSKKTDGTETIEYVESQNFKPFTVLMNVDSFITQIKAYPLDALEIHYGNPMFITLNHNKTTQILSLLVEEGAEA